MADSPVHFEFERWSGLSLEELRRRAEELGVETPPGADRRVLAHLMEGRLALIGALDRGAVLDLARWAQVRVENDPAMEVMVRGILSYRAARYDDLSLRGLRALAVLRDLPAGEDEPREAIEQRLIRAGGWREVVRRQRRRVVGALLSKALDWSGGAGGGEPSSDPAAGPPPSIKEHIERQGVVGGIARTIRGVADDYVAEKLDEIEVRIDRKMDEIDRRLAEWRDREISNRLKILKLTLIFSILVALLSLGYDFVRRRTMPERPTSAAVQGEAEAAAPANRGAEAQSP